MDRYGFCFCSRSQRQILKYLMRSTSTAGDEVVVDEVAVVDVTLRDSSVENEAMVVPTDFDTKLKDAFLDAIACF